MKFEGKIADQVKREIKDTYKKDLDRQVSRIWELVRVGLLAMINQLRVEEIGDQIRDQIEDHSRYQIRDQLWYQLEDQIWYQIRDTLWDHIRDTHKELRKWDAVEVDQ